VTAVLREKDAGVALLTVDRLRKSHGGRVLFDIAALRLERASAYVLTGVNGAGKSTLLRILAGLEQPDRIADSGPPVADFDGRRLRLSPYPAAMRQSIVYVHQHPIMFSTSIAHNIGYGLLARGMPKAQVAREVDEAMAWAGLGYLRGSDPASLSGGEKQRVALARARVLGARLLLLDEPTANLDGAAREQVIALIPTLTDGGSSVVMACHDRDLIGLPGVQRLKLRDGAMEYR
jgi:tungstate transport system ATP-binding protein